MSYTDQQHQSCPECRSPMRTIYQCKEPPFGVLHRCRPCAYRLTPDAWQRLWEQKEREREKESSHA